MGRLVATPRRLYGAAAAGVLLLVVAVNALAPAPAAAGPFGTDLGPVDDFTAGIKEGFSAPLDAAGDAVSGIGGGILQSALEWLLGGFETVVTVWLVRFLVTIHVPIGGQLQDTIAPLIVVGGFFLAVGMMASVANGYREIIAGTDTAPRVIGQAIFRVVGLALLMAAWPWVVPLAVETANGMTSYILSDAAVANALRETYAAGKLNPILWLLAVIFMAIAMLILIVMKFMLAIAFACLFVGGPALIGFAALPGVGPMALSMVTRGLVTLTAIPLAWTVVFVAWASVSGGMFDAFDGGGVVGGVMGPGLFIAGLVIMLALTKKLLSMASFGLRTGIPGAGIARSVINVTAARAAVGAAASAAAGAQEASGPVKGGDGAPVRGAHFPQSGQQGQEAPTRAAAANVSQSGQQEWRKLVEPVVGGSGGGAATRQPQQAARDFARAHERETVREERAIEANGPFHTQGGAFAGTPRVDEDQRRDLIAQSEIVRSQIDRQGGAITPGELREKTDRLGSGRSAIFGSAAASGHYSDPQVGKVRYEDELLDRGSELRRPEDREAVAWAIAAGPDVAKQAFEPEWNTFGHRKPEADGSPGGGQGPAAPYLKTNPDAFSFGGAAKRPRP